MGLVDKINSVPLGLASKVVKKTGKSKYSLAQACSFAAACPAIYATIDSYNNHNYAYLFGGMFCFTQFMRTLYLGKRAQMDDPKTLEDMTRMLDAGMVSRFKENKNLLDAADSKASKSAFIWTLEGVLLGSLAIFDSLYFTEIPGDIKENLFYFSLFGPPIVLHGISEYFRAAK